LLTGATAPNHERSTGPKSDRLLDTRLMRYASLGSGSAGNAVLVEHGGSAIIIDCGLSLRELERRSARLAFDTTTLVAVVVTHEHNDHISGVPALARRYALPVHLSSGTRRAAAARLTSVPDIEEFRPGRPFDIGAFSMYPVIVPHDAREPCQFVIEVDGNRLGILTDLGQLTAHLERSFSDLDALFLEFNHDSSMLETSAYPFTLRQRIAGGYGHLSNAQAESFLRRMDQTRLSWLTAGHLSEKTNTAAEVLACLRRTLATHVQHHIASQIEPSPWFHLD
ncbi:MAG: MBL fold metallo-hydrolase, partial [Dehalococcoidia bacterium]